MECFFIVIYETKQTKQKVKSPWYDYNTVYYFFSRHFCHTGICVEWVQMHLPGMDGFSSTPWKIKQV